MKDYELKYLKKVLKQKIEDETKKENNHRDLIKDGSLKEGINELSTYDNHPADLGSETFEMEKQFALEQRQKNIKMDLADALKRMDSGQYGICEFCGNEIAFERLEALPAARLCIKCEKGREDNAFSDENDVIDFNRVVNKTAYDGEDAWQDVERYGSSSGPQDLSVNQHIDYNNDFYDSDEDVGYVEDVEKISNAQYLSQLPDLHGNSYEGYVNPQKAQKEDIDYFGEEEGKNNDIT